MALVNVFFFCFSWIVCDAFSVFFFGFAQVDREGFSVLERAVVQHNLRAVSKVCDTLV